MYDAPRPGHPDYRSPPPSPRLGAQDHLQHAQDRVSDLRDIINSLSQRVKELEQDRAQALYQLERSREETQSFKQILGGQGGLDAYIPILREMRLYSLQEKDKPLAHRAFNDWIHLFEHLLGTSNLAMGMISKESLDKFNLAPLRAQWEQGRRD